VTSVAVLVPTWRRPRDLARCLDALRAQERAPDRVLVVRRPEDEETRAVLGERDDPCLQEVLVHEPGQVAALNAGLAEVREDVVAITDDDGAPWPDWIRRIREHFDRDRQLGGLGGRDWVYRDADLQDGDERTIGRVAWYGRFIAFHHLGRGAIREVDFLKGANMSYRRSAIDGIAFDTGLRGGGAQYHNDWAISLAVKRHGWKVVYDPDVAIDHHEGTRPESEKRVKKGARSELDRRIAANKAFNETYVALRYLPLMRVVMHLPFVLALGTTHAPGPGLALVRMRSIGGPRAALVEAVSSIRARGGGALAGARVRIRDSGRHPLP
jgi:GT2 family glycosyltransferase